MEEEREYKGGMIEEWNEEEDEGNWWRLEDNRKYLEGLKDEEEDMGDLRDPYNKLWRKSPWNKELWEGGGVINCHFP